MSEFREYYACYTEPGGQIEHARVTSAPGGGALCGTGWIENRTRLSPFRPDHPMACPSCAARVRNADPTAVPIVLPAQCRDVLTDYMDTWSYGRGEEEKALRVIFSELARDLEQLKLERASAGERYGAGLDGEG
jgi:hypothetical protein